MKKILIFLFAIVPMGLIVSPVLSLLLAIVVFCRSFADYWEGLVTSWFGLEQEEKELSVWEKHQKKLDGLASLNQGTEKDG